MLCGRRTNTYFSYTKYIVRFMSGLYVGSIVFIIDILVVTIELFYYYLTQLNKGGESFFILKERVQCLGIPTMDIASSLFNFGTPFGGLKYTCIVQTRYNDKSNELISTNLATETRPTCTFLLLPYVCSNC